MSLHPSVYFNDVATEFMNHYLALMQEDPNLTEPMYDKSPNVKLVIDKIVTTGHSEVFQQIKNLGKLEYVPNSKFYAQPYDGTSILINAKFADEKGKTYSTGIILEEVDKETHEFAITFQVMCSLNNS